MKRALLYRFIGILLLALAISSVVSYYFFGNQMKENTINNMLNTIGVLDYSFEFKGDLQQELINLEQITLNDKTRLTIIDMTGKVRADTNTSHPDLLENHLNREEVQEAIHGEYGYATRYSTTLKENMLYVARVSQKGDYIIRMSVPYTSILSYLVSIFPILLVGVGIAFIVSMVLAFRFTNTITRPLQEISDEMQKAQSQVLDFNFKQYRYDELNIISDTTVQLAEEIRERITQIEFEKRIRQEFFSNASHELKTPITSVKGYAELLDQGFVKDEEVKKDFITRILKETDNMTNLINDILMISRLETKEAEVTFSMVRMSPLIKEIFESLEPIAVEYQVHIHEECEPIIIEASAKQLRELIMNLMSNGIKYNHSGGDVWLTVVKRAENMVITVRDNGMGISTEERERIFERFYRVDKGRSKKVGGTGLGLSIVKHIVEFYHGNIELNSKVSEGSTFEVSIPIKRVIS